MIELMVLAIAATIIDGTPQRLEVLNKIR